jgi:hypothetical protein
MRISFDVRGLTIKFANSPPCACRCSCGQKPPDGLKTLAYQRSTVMLLLIYGSHFLSGVYYCLSVFWCAVARMSELQLERTNIKFLEEYRLQLSAHDNSSFANFFYPEDGGDTFLRNVG